jgi:predicted nucleic acid-binding protein
MTRYVIGPDVAIRLAGDEAVVPDGHHMLAPALLRPQMLSLLYQAVHRGEVTKEDAERRLLYARGMRIRLHEDQFLQDAAWQVADQLGWPDTFDAEYVALTQLQADALITLDRRLAEAVKDLVTVAPVEALFASLSPGQVQVGDRALERFRGQGDGLGQRGMRVDGQADVGGVGAHLDGQRRLGDEVSR